MQPTSQSSTVDLTPEETRVLGALIEKAHTTPDQYPLSSNALRAACNQKTSRQPVVDYPLQLVDRTMQLLRDAGWARSVRGAGDRAFKHKHVIDEKLGLADDEQAVLAVLMLRGAQAPGELRTRTERYVPFETPAEVEEVLRRLAARQPPLVRNVGREPGQSQDRWIQLIGDTGGAAPPGAGVGGATATEAGAGDAPDAGADTDGGSVGPPGAGPEVAAGSGDAGIASGSTGAELATRGGLERRVAALERRLAALEAELGLGDGDGPGDGH